MRGPPFRTPGRPSKNVAASLSDRVLDVAREVFAVRGIAAASMEEIAAAGGFSKHTVYRRYPSKLALVGEVLERDLTRQQAAMLETLAAGGGGLVGLRALARAMFDHARDPTNQALMSAILMDGPLAEGLRRRTASSLAALQEPVVQAMLTAREEAAIPRCDPHRAADTLANLAMGSGIRLGVTGDLDPAAADLRFANCWLSFLRYLDGSPEPEGNGIAL